MSDRGLKYKIVEGFEQFQNSEYIALDFETVSIQNKTMTLFSIAAPDGAGGYIGAAFRPEAMDRLFDFIKGRKVVFHNWIFDGQVLIKYGFDVFSFDIEDTLLMSVILDENRSPGLKERCLHEFNFVMTKWNAVNKEDIRAYKKYAVEDVVGTAALYDLYKPIIIHEGLVLAYTTEKKASFPIMFMEINGVGYCRGTATRLKGICKKEMYAAEDSVFNDAQYFFEIASTTQLRRYIYNDLQIPINREWVTAKTRQPATDIKTLEKIMHSLPLKDNRIESIQKIIEHSKFRKLFTSFFDNVEENANSSNDGRVHASINQAVAVTGRLSVSKPGLHQTPRDPLYAGDMSSHIRSMFVPSSGCVVIGSDYSQIELRMTAHLSRDDNMIKGYLSGVDFHTVTSKAIGCSREMAKTINFSILFGMGIKNLAFNLRVTIPQAKLFLKKYYETFAGIIELRKNIVERVRYQGYIQMINGRRRRVSPLASVRDIESFAGSGAIQGGAAVVMKMGMIKSFDRFKNEGVKQVLSIHDELLYECPTDYAEEAAKLIKKDMEEAVELLVPLVVKPKIGVNFAECK